MIRSIVERRREEEALHWHQPYTEAVPLDLWELFRAITYEGYGEVTRENLMETVAFYSKKSDKLDAYRIYPEEGDGILTAGSSFKLTVGIRYGMDVDDYDTPFVSNETAALFNLDPLKYQPSALDRKVADEMVARFTKEQTNTKTDDTRRH